MKAHMLVTLALTACRPFLSSYDGTDTNVVDTDVVDTDTDVVDTDTGVVDTDTGVVDTDVVQFGDWDHLGDAPWGMNLNIVDVTGATSPDGVFQVGDVPTITFTAVDADGVPYMPDDFTSLQFGVTGPTTHMDIVYYGPDNEGDPSNLVPVSWDPAEAPEGIAWSYTFPTPIPPVYHAAPNDTLDIGEDLGDWGGLPLESGTYMFGVWGYTRHDDESQPVFDAASAITTNLLGDGAEDYPRERVLTSNCNKCHGALEMHDRKIAGDVSVCLMCHVMGSEDAYSPQDPTTTTGLSLFLPVIIHKLHAGTYLSKPYIVNGAPVDESDPNWPKFNAKDYSNVAYTTLPSGTAECFTCHGGAAQGDVQDRSTRNACGACHDAIVWATGEGHGTGGVANDDLSCANSGCHPPSTIVLEHRDARFDPAQNPGINLDILHVSGGTGTGGQFLPGDKLTIEYTATHNDGSPADVKTELISGAVRLGGPLEHMQLTMELKDLAAQSVEDIVYHTWKYTTTTALPAAYPPQYNDSADLDVAAGDWKGLPLANGTYRLMVSGYRYVILPDLITKLRVPAASTTAVLVGTATQVTTHAPVDQAKCESCHNKLWGHGGSRTNVLGCPICHTAGAEDKITLVPSSPGLTVEFAILMHRMHSGANLSAPYVLNGVDDFSNVVYPRMDGGTTNCQSCHVEGGYDAISGHVCASCHDSAATAAHIALTTDPVYGESCIVCHGPEKDQSVEHVHGLK